MAKFRNVVVFENDGTHFNITMPTPVPRSVVINKEIYLTYEHNIPIVVDAPKRSILVAAKRSMDDDVYVEAVTKYLGEQYEEIL